MRIKRALLVHQVSILISRRVLGSGSSGPTFEVIQILQSNSMQFISFVNQLPSIFPVLGEYVMALKQAPKDPLISLCIGMTFIHMASQKFASRRHSLVIQVKILKKFLQMLRDIKLWNNQTNGNTTFPLLEISISVAFLVYCLEWEHLDIISSMLFHAFIQSRFVGLFIFESVLGAERWMSRILLQLRQSYAPIR